MYVTVIITHLMIIKLNSLFIYVPTEQPEGQLPSRDEEIEGTKMNTNIQDDKGN
jgi:hypothetical protein